MSTYTPSIPRSRLGWWLLVAAVGLALLFVLHSFVGTFVLALFVYYGFRPLDRRLTSYLSPGPAAAASLLVVALPVLLLVSSLLVVGVTELSNAGWLDGLKSMLPPALRQVPTANPLAGLKSLLGGGFAGSATQALGTGLSVLSTVANGGMQLFLAITAAFYLLRDDYRLAGWFRSTVAGEGTTAHAYVSAVDEDLGTIYFGNVLLVGFVGLFALFVYHGYNLVAPSAVGIPVPTALALLTGLGSLIPLVVGKVVYVPLTLYLGVQAARSDPGLLAFPAGLFVASLLLLDLLPMTFLLPKVAGKGTHTGLVLFAYILGTMLFGWYGLFLGPFLLVVGIQLVRIVLEELLHGDPLTPEVTSARSIGATPGSEDD